MKSIKDSLKNKFIIIIALLFIADVAIFLDFPFLRQILVFACFMIIPGLLFLYALKLNKIDIFRKFVLSYGVSISLLMFTALFINFLYPSIGIPKPLSTTSLVISYNVVILILCFIVYKRNENEVGVWNGFNIKSNIKNNELISPLMFAIFIPFLSILGTHLMNTTGNNIILLAIPFLILIYAVFIIYFNKSIPKITYPIAILMIGITLTFILPLRGEYMIIGSDGAVEYHSFWLTATSSHWSMSTDSVNACLSVGLLHSIFQSLLNLSTEYTYKLVTPLLISIIPLALFILFRKYIGEVYAFLSSLFFASQYSFIHCICGARIFIGVFFIALAIMVFFDEKVDILNKRILFIVFMFSLILSYYSYCYLFAILMFLSWLILSIATIRFVNLRKKLTLTLVTLYIVGIFFWWSQITESHFSTGIMFFEQTLQSLTRAFLTESHDTLAQQAVGMGLHGTVEILNFIVYYVTLILIAIGSIDLIRKHKTSKFGVEYTSMVVACLMVWVIMIAAPYPSEGFGIARAYFPTLILLSPMMIIGARAICQLPAPKNWWYIVKHVPKLHKHSFNSDSKFKDSSSKQSSNHYKRVIAIALIVILLQFMVNMGITYQMFGNPRSVILNSEGLQYDIWYIHTQEIQAGKWLMKNIERGHTVYTDAYTPNRFVTIRGEEKIRVDNNFFERDKQIGKGYIFLRYQNIVAGTIYSWYFRKDWSDYAPITNYSHLFVGKSKIYNNDGSEVWK